MSTATGERIETVAARATDELVRLTLLDGHEALRNRRRRRLLLELAPTTVALLTGHKDAGFTYRVYAKDGRDTATVVQDVLVRAASAGIGQ